MVKDLLTHFLVALVIFVPLETLLPRRKDKKIFREHLLVDVSYALLAGIVIVAGMTGLFIFAQTGIRPLVPEVVRDAISNQPLILQVLEIIVIADIGYYLIHRMFHELPGLWRFHAIHHSIEDMDWIAGSRVHPIDQIMTRGVSMMVPIAMGYTGAAMAVFALFFSWHSVLKHSNVKVSFGIFRWILATPTYHHWHHANQSEAFDKNFAGQLPIIDLLFGTAIMKEKDGPKIYGTNHPVPKDFPGQLIDPFRRPREQKSPVHAPVAESQR